MCKIRRVPRLQETDLIGSIPDEQGGRYDVRASPEALAWIKENGGSLFIWAEHGLTRTSPSPPTHIDASFREVVPFLWCGSSLQTRLEARITNSRFGAPTSHAASSSRGKTRRDRSAEASCG
jgi:hypothetical protein